jgi:isocitrate dehydrogenase
MKRITIAKGDGIGPEIMNSVLQIFKAADVPIACDEIKIGESVFLTGNTSGIDEHSWDIIRRNKIYLKAPITTPQGSGYKSLNVTTRKALGLFANIRPCISYFPFVETKFPNMDVVIIRENEEDLYAGIEHQQTDEVIQCLKLISRPGCEKIIRYAFEYARSHGRKKVTCFSKDNIMKQTDGLFHQVFNEIAIEYPEIETNHMIIDIGTAILADQPEKFDVIVTLNLYGDIISDVAAQIAGSVGLAGSVNIGEECAMFEAIHGSAPDIAGKNIANPSGLIQAGVSMLLHVGLNDSAELIQNAWLKTIEDGYHTADIFNEKNSVEKMTTSAFTEKVISNLGNKPKKFKELDASSYKEITIPRYQRKKPKAKKLVGVDLFVHWASDNTDEIGELMKQQETIDLSLKMITNRGIKVWPEGFKETFCTDHWRCRFMCDENTFISNTAIIELLKKYAACGIDIIKTENLYQFDGKNAFSMGQGQ